MEWVLGERNPVGGRGDDAICKQVFHLIFQVFFKGFIYFHFKDLYHQHKVGSKVVFSSFSCVRLFSACCSGVTGPWSSYCHRCCCCLSSYTYI